MEKEKSCASLYMSTFHISTMKEARKELYCFKTSVGYVNITRRRAQLVFEVMCLI